MEAGSLHAAPRTGRKGPPARASRRFHPEAGIGPRTSLHTHFCLVEYAYLSKTDACETGPPGVAGGVKPRHP